MTLIRGDLPGTAYSNATYLLNRLTNNAIRSGVAINISFHLRTKRDQ